MRLSPVMELAPLPTPELKAALPAATDDDPNPLCDEELDPPLELDPVRPAVRLTELRPLPLDLNADRLE